MSVLDDDLLSDVLLRLEELAESSETDSFEQLVALDSELHSKFASDTVLAESAEQRFAALRAVDHCLRDVESVSDVMPSIAGYEFVEEIGRGGMGRVYRARQQGVGRAVAIKVLLAGQLAGKRLRKRFVQEATAIGRLQHPHIVQVFESGEAKGVAYLALEYVEGGNLAQSLRGRPHSNRYAAEMVSKLALAVQFAHERGIVHRDLKPSNILLAHDGAPKIADFGLARLLEDDTDLTRSGEAPGTPSYMAPEQVYGAASPSVDIYALGAILYEILTGRPPFLASTVLGTLEQLRTADSLPPRKLAPEISRDLEAICLKCLEKAPHRRYATAEALATDLGRFLKGEPTLVRPLTSLQRTVHWIRRRPTFASLITVSVGSVLILAVLSALYVVRLREARASSDAERARAETIAEHNARYMYAAHMRTGYEQRAVGQIERVERLLDEYGPGKPYTHLRGFEWYHLKRDLHGERMTLRGHRGELNAVIFSQDGRQLVSGGEDGTIRCWDVATGAELTCFPAHTNCVNSLCFSPDGQLLASGSCDSTIKLWDATAFALLATLAGDADRVDAVAFSPVDGNRLASCGSDSIARIWDLQTRSVVQAHDTKRGPLYTLAWRADGQLLFIGAGGVGRAAKSAGDSGSTVIAWDLVSNEELEETPNHNFDVPTITLAMSHADKRLCAGINTGVYEVMHREPQSRSDPLRGHVGTVQAVRYSHDDELLASGGNDRTIRIWDVTRGMCSQVLTGHGERVGALAFSPCDATLASAGFDGTVKIWGPLKSSRPIRRVRSPGFRSYDLWGTHDLAISADCRWFALRDAPDRIVVLDIADNNRELCRIPVASAALTAISFPQDDRREILNIAQDGGDLLKWNVTKNRLESGSLNLLTRSPLDDATAYSLRHLKLSDDGQYLFTIDGQGVIIIETSSKRLLHTFPSHNDAWGCGVCFSPDGKTAGIATQLESHLWNLDSDDLRNCGEPCCIANHGNWMVQHKGHFLHILDPASDAEPLRLEHSMPVQAYVFSPNGRTLATWTNSEDAVRTNRLDMHLWNTATGEAMAHFAAPPGGMRAMRFSADGRKLCAVTVVAEPPDESGSHEERFHAVVWHGDEGR